MDLVRVVRVGIKVSSSVFDLAVKALDGGLIVLVVALRVLFTGTSPVDSLVVGEIGLSGLFSLSFLSSISSMDTNDVAFAALRPPTFFTDGAVDSSWLSSKSVFAFLVRLAGFISLGSSSAIGSTSDEAFVRVTRVVLVVLSFEELVSVGAVASASGSTLCDRARVPRRNGFAGADNSSSVGVAFPPLRDGFVTGAIT